MSDYFSRSSSPLASEDDLRSSPSIKSTKASSSNASNNTSSTSSSVSSVVSKAKKLATFGKSSPVQDIPTGPALKLAYPSLFDGDADIQAASKSISEILVSLKRYVESFKCPSALDFSADPENHLLLVGNEKNEEFINQLVKLSNLRAELAKVPTHENLELKDMKHVAETSIARALQKMRDRQRELYNQFKTELIHQEDPAAALQNLHTSMLACTKRFQYPEELDFSAQKENLLLQTDKNRRFIDQFRKIEKYRDELSNVQTHGDVELEEKYRDVSIAIGRALQQLKSHQREIYEKPLKRSHESKSGSSPHSRVLNATGTSKDSSSLDDTGALEDSLHIFTQESSPLSICPQFIGAAPLPTQSLAPLEPVSEIMATSGIGMLEGPTAAALMPFFAWHAFWTPLLFYLSLSHFSWRLTLLSLYVLMPDQLSGAPFGRLRCSLFVCLTTPGLVFCLVSVVLLLDSVEQLTFVRITPGLVFYFISVVLRLDSVEQFAFVRHVAR